MKTERITPRPLTRLRSWHCEQILFALGFVALSQMAQGVSPAPDGGYPGGNTAEGQNALLSLTSGTYNTAVGFFSLKTDTKGEFNTAIGAGALLANAGDQSTGAGVENTATGAGALLNNTTGCCNTADGAFALFSNINAAENAAFGTNALFSNIEANDNSAFGYNALMSNTGGGNTAVGAYSLISHTTGVLNTAVGVSALAAQATGDQNTALGYAAGGNVTTANNVICIGALTGGANVDNSCYIGNVWNQSGGSQPVYVNSDGKLGALVSSRRFKNEIKPMQQASRVIYSLRPVSFRYKPEIEPTCPRGFGLIAEEVEEVSPDLVTRDTDGKANSVRYDQVNAMLLNEFLKEHKKVEKQASEIQEQKVTITELQCRIDTVVRCLNEHDSKIQQVSAHLETSRPALQLAIGDP